MDNIQREKVLILAKYVDTLQSIFASINKTSVLRIIVYAFILNNFNYSNDIIPAQVRKNRSSLLISLMNNEKKLFFYDMEFILEGLVILEKNNMIEVKEGIIYNKKCSKIIDNSSLFNHVVACINADSDTFVLREVLNYV